MASVRTRRTITTAAALLAGTLAGCGGDGGSNDAVELTKRLPTHAIGYTALDLAALKSDLGLPDDADPLSAPRLRGTAYSALAGLMPPLRRRIEVVRPGEDISSEPLKAPRAKILDSLDPGLITAVATSQRGKAGGGSGVTVLATSEDIGEIGSALGDLGFRDRGGVLEDPDGGAAVRLDDATVYASDDEDLLRSLPDDPVDDLPAELLDELEGDQVRVARSDGCVQEYGSAGSDDGTAEFAFLVEGEADPAKVQISEPSGIDVGATEVDGDVVKVRVESTSDGRATPEDLQSELLPGYDCG